MTFDVFNQQMERLRGLRFVPASLQTHWEALQDLPVDVLDAAITQAQKTRAEFPTPVELRQDADLVSHLVRAVLSDDDRGVDLPQPFTIDVPQAGKVVSITREWKYFCEICSDHGMRSWWCGDQPSTRYPWMPARRCANRNCRKVGYEHEYVERCACWDTNPALVRKREAQRQYAEAPPKRRA